jgi:DNA excision repair protein ERCC-3
MPGPLIVQSDRTVLLETDHPQSGEARHELAIFAELERAPEHIHTYRITRLGLWNARAAGHDAQFIIDSLTRFSKYPLPESVTSEIRNTIDRFGKLVIARDEKGLVLESESAAILTEVCSNPKVSELLEEKLAKGYRVSAWARGQLKQQLLKLAGPLRTQPDLPPAPLTRFSSKSRVGNCATTRIWRWRSLRKEAQEWWSFPAVQARPWWVLQPWPDLIPTH